MNGKRLNKGVIPTQFEWVGPEKNDRPNPLTRLRRSMHDDFHASDISDSEDEEMDTTPAPNSPFTDPVPLPQSVEPSPTTAPLIDDLQAQVLRQAMQIKELQQFKEQATKRIAQLEKDNEELNIKLSLERFGVDRFGSDDQLFKFYTGFVSADAFKVFFEYVKPAAHNMQRAYYQGVEQINSLAGRPTCMKLIDEMFLFLCRLRLGLHEVDLADRFNCSLSTVSRKIITWANLLYFVLGSWNIWLSKDIIQEKMPHCFKEKYSSTRAIIDCTEIKSQTPKSLVLNSQLYSHYKGANTFKGLIGIAPHGVVTFVSPLYTGCMSDVEITQLSGILDLFEEGDSCMADKGFTIEKLLKEKNAHLTSHLF